MNPIEYHTLYSDSIYNPSYMKRINERLAERDEDEEIVGVDLREVDNGNKGIELLHNEYVKLSKEIAELTRIQSEIQWVMEAFDRKERDYVKIKRTNRCNMLLPLNYYIKTNGDEILPTEGNYLDSKD